MKRLFILFLGLLCLNNGYSQNEIDALRYSFFDLGGSARYVGMAGAFGALGADIGSLSSNPAGIALYRRSEFAFTLGFAGTSTDASYRGNLSEEDYINTNINSVGVVGSYAGNEGTNVVRINFGVGYNKLRNFNQDMRIQGTEENTTLLDVFALQADGFSPNEITDAFPFGAGLAYESYLIDPFDSNSTQYMTAIPFGSVNQEKFIERRGSMGETLISGGANFGDQVFFGMSIGFPSLRFSESSRYTESDLDEDVDLDGFIFNDELSATGNGINIKAGIIVKPVDWFRFGAAIHSPTWWSINEQYERSMYSEFKNGDQYEWLSPLGNYQYRLTTPSRYLANTAIIVGKIAVLSVDYEYVNYSQNKLRNASRISDEYDFAVENEVIADIYRSTHNVKAGLEWRIHPSFRLRGGASYQQNPFVDEAVQDNPAILTYAGGIGYRKGGFFTDVAYSLRKATSDYYLYDPAMVEATTVNNSNGQVLVTIGFRY
jgi:long-subunit fatty acid transport protein